MKPVAFVILAILIILAIALIAIQLTGTDGIIACPFGLFPYRNIDGFEILTEQGGWINSNPAVLRDLGCEWNE